MQRRVVREVDDAHAPAIQLAFHTVVADACARGKGRGLDVDAGAQGGRAEHPVGGGDQLFDLAPRLRLRSAQLIQNGVPTFRRGLQHTLEDLGSVE
jgi:hypothetical protein